MGLIDNSTVGSIDSTVDSIDSKVDLIGLIDCSIGSKKNGFNNRFKEKRF